MGLPDVTQATRVDLPADTTARLRVPVVPAKVRVPPADGLPRERLQARLAGIWRTITVR
jgi:hypothetical protein